MKTTHTFSIHFWLKRKAERRDGKAPVYARITVNGRRAELSLKEFILTEHWCSDTGRVKFRASGAQKINNYLSEVQSDLTDCKKELKNEGKFISAQSIKSRYLGEDKPVTTLKELMKYHRENDLEKLENGTAKNYGATEKYLCRFVKKAFKTSDVNLAQIDYSFVVKFDSYLRVCPPLRKSQPLGNNGIMKHLERFQKFTTLALKFGWINHNPFGLHELKFEDYDCAFLDQYEIQKVLALDIVDSGLRLVRDIFIFSCYTGLCYIETKLLKKTDIVLGIDGEQWIDVRRKKTKTPVKIPLLDQAETIVAKYSDYPSEDNDFSLLPVYSNQKVNEYLKKIAKLCGIKKNLTFHVARHSFATTVTLLNDVPLETVSKLLGHTKLSTTQVYARVVERKISNDMAALKIKLKSMEKPKKENEELAEAS